MSQNTRYSGNCSYVEQQWSLLLLGWELVHHLAAEFSNLLPSGFELQQQKNGMKCCSPHSKLIASLENSDSHNSLQSMILPRDREGGVAQHTTKQLPSTLFFHAMTGNLCIQKLKTKVISQKLQSRVVIYFWWKLDNQVTFKIIQIFFRNESQ